MINERTEDAASRRLRYELGFSGVELSMILPHFRYRAEKDGVVENEICPVLVGFTDQRANINKKEVAEVKWMPWAELLTLVESGEPVLSPWAVEEVLLLAENEYFRRTLAKNIKLQAAV